MRGRRDDTSRSKRSLPIGSGRHRSADSIAHPGHVVVRHPAAQIDDSLGEVNLIVQDAEDLSYGRRAIERRAVSNHATDNITPD